MKEKRVKDRDSLETELVDIYAARWKEFRNFVFSKNLHYIATDFLFLPQKYGHHE
jgi:hypothetical protein